MEVGHGILAGIAATIVYFDFDSLWMSAKYMVCVLYCFDAKTNQIVSQELCDHHVAEERSILCCCGPPVEADLKRFVDDVVIYR